jgi:hypothetical protein
MTWGLPRFAHGRAVALASNPMKVFIGLLVLRRILKNPSPCSETAA